MSLEQQRIIEQQQRSLKKAHRALAEQAQHTEKSLQAFAEAVSRACQQLESGYSQLASEQLRQLHADILKEVPNDRTH